MQPQAQKVVQNISPKEPNHPLVDAALAEIVKVNDPIKVLTGFKPQGESHSQSAQGGDQAQSAQGESQAQSAFQSFGKFIAGSREQGFDYAFAFWCWQHENLDKLVLLPPIHHGKTSDLARQVYHRLNVRLATEKLVSRQRLMVVLFVIGAIMLSILTAVLSSLITQHSQQQASSDNNYSNPPLFDPQIASLGHLSFVYVGLSLLFGLAYAGLALFLIPVFVRGVVTEDIRQEVKGIVRRCFLRDILKDSPEDLADVWRHGWVTSEATPISTELTDTDASSTAAVRCVKTFRWIVIGAFLYQPLCATLFIPVIIWWIFTLNASKTDLSQRMDEMELQRSVEGSLFIATGGQAWATLQEKARTEQMANAIKDETPVAKLGETTGIMAARGDLFAPSADMPFQMSLRDLQNHMIVFGGIGAGKTSGILRPLATQIANWPKVGIVIMDGKAALPKELAKLSGMQVVDPANMDVSLISGLTPNEVVDTISELLTDSKSTERFWTDSAAGLLRRAAVLAQAAGEDDWTLFTIGQVATVKDARNRVIQKIPKETALGSEEVMEALSYFRNQWDTEAAPGDRTRSSILTITQTWMSTIMGHPHLLKWGKTSKGVDITTPLRGGRIGFLIPGYRYGRAGAVVTALLKSRLYAGLKARADQAMGEDETPVVFLIDEVQEVATEEDATMLAIGRSLNLAMIGATQTVEGMRERLGEATADKLLSIYGGLVALPGRSPLTDEFTAKRFGLTWAAAVQDRPGAPLRETMQQDVLTGVSAASRFQGFMQVSLDGPRNKRGVLSAFRSSQRGSAEPRSKIAPVPIIVSGEIQTLLAKPDTALVAVTRSRILRRDVVQLKPEY